MVTVPAKDLKNRTGDVVRRLERGEGVLITKRGKPLAVMRPVRGTGLRWGRRRGGPDVVRQGVGLLAGFLSLKDLAAEKRADARREDRKWGIKR